MSPKCSCIECKREYSTKGIHTHYIISHTEDGKARHAANSLVASAKGSATTSKKYTDIRNQSEIKYMEDPNYCAECGTVLPYDKRRNKYCNHTCSAISRNRNVIRSGWTEEQKAANRRPSTTNKDGSRKPKTIAKQKKIVKEASRNPSGPFSKLFKNNCGKCRKVFYNETQKKFCTDCEHCYSHNGRAKYWFTFNVFHYPDLFDLSLITTIGFRDTKSNPNGITRDHRVSVAEALKYDYDTYYIKHPVNCELMRFDVNNRKKTRSSITYDELVRLVDEYDSVSSLNSK